MKTTPTILREKGYQSGNGGGAGTQEPGSVENRLSLDPSAFPFTQDWEDGKDYPGMIDGNKITLTQISPGEFEVTNDSESESPAEDASAGEEAEPSMPMMKGKSKNPAVAGLME